MSKWKKRLVIYLFLQPENKRKPSKLNWIRTFQMFMKIMQKKKFFLECAALTFYEFNEIEIVHLAKYLFAQVAIYLKRCNIAPENC